jgi:serine/threonine protein kinase/WD40 repeat protein
MTENDQELPARPGRSSREADIDDQIAEVIEDVIGRRSRGEALPDEQIVQQHPHLLPDLKHRLRDLHWVRGAERVVGRAERAGTVDQADGTDPRNASWSHLPAGAIPGLEIREEIHRGGQGVVYRAVQLSTGREVAVKVTRDGPLLGPRDKARFEREVRLLAQLKHPNIVTIYDSGVAAGTDYFVMDYIVGQPLDGHLERAGISLREKVALFAKISEAVAAAHLRGVIHRDLKPANIMIDRQGEPHILDFGLARFASEEIEGKSLWQAMTETGHFVGSVPWASPEQVGGARERIDLRTDVYSLGVVFYQTLTGRFPYVVHGAMREVFENILDAAPTKPSALNRHVDGELETIVLKCLAKEPQRRYQSAIELARDMRRYLACEPIDAKRDSTFYVLRKHMRRHRFSVSAAAGLVLILIASSILAWTLYARSQDNLWQAYLAQARAGRMSGRMGQRLVSLKALAKAAAIRPSVELRDEAINCLELTDVRVVRQEQTAYTTDVAQCGFSMDGEHYWLWEAATEKTFVRRLSDHQTVLTLPAVPSGGYGAAPRFSRDGRYLARVAGSTCEVWDIERAELIAAFAVDATNYARPLDFSPDGGELAVGCKDGSIHIRSPGSNEARSLPPVHAPVHCVRFDPTGRFLATSSLRSSDVLIRNALTGKVLRTLTHAGRVWRITWSPDGSQLGTACGDRHAYVWNTETGERQFLLVGHKAEVTHISFNRTGTLLLSSAWDGSTRLWDPRDGASLLIVPAMAGESFFDDAGLFGFRSFTNGMMVGTAKVVFGSATEKLLGPQRDTPTDGCQSSRISTDGRWMTCASEGGVRLWDLRRGAQTSFLPINWSVFAAFSPDMSELITVSETGVMSWPVEIAERVMHIGPPELLLPSEREGLGESGFTSKGRKLVVASTQSDRAFVLDREHVGEPRTIGPHPQMQYISISPDDRFLATGTWRGSGVRIWNLANGQLLHELPIDRGANVGFSPDGKWLITSEAEHIFWQTDTWQPVARFDRPAYTSVPGPIAFSPDGRLVALAGHDTSVLLVDLLRLERVAEFDSRGIPQFEALSFSADNERVLLPFGDAVHVWDLRAIRAELAAIGLDWDMPGYPPAPAVPVSPMRVEVELGELAPGTEGPSTTPASQP